MSKLLDEIWKPIVGYEGLYEISNHGRVFGLKWNKIMKDKYDYAKYRVIGLTKDGQQKVLKVHRLVAEAFLQDFYEYNAIGYHVDHIDGNKSNNHISNLQMLSHFENCYKRTGRNAFQLLKAVNIETGEEFIFEGQNEAARKLSLNQGNINNVLSGRIKQTGGYTFIRLEKEVV